MDFSAIVFVGNTLGPLFLEDPATGSAGQLYLSFADLDTQAAAADWPFGNSASVQTALELMQTGLSAYKLNEPDDELLWEFRRLFIGPAARPAPPYGSVYTDKECVLFGKSELDLRDWLRENRIAFSPAIDEPADHIGYMLLLMAWLAEHRPKLVKDYLQNHLLTWSAHFLDQLEQASKHSFYKGLAELSKLTLEEIEQDLELEITYPRFYR